jgi:hypothetical protein
VIKSITITVLLVLATAALAVAGEPVVIASVEYEITGRTLPYYLEQKAKLEQGMAFEDLAAFEMYLARVKQWLLNERVLESVEFDLRYGIEVVDGTLPVNVVIKTRDTWNIIALPYFRYDSNDGLLLSGRMRDYNFLGTLLPLRVNANYEQDLGGEVVWGGDFDFSYPFPAYGLDWSLDLDGSLKFYAAGSNPAVSISMALSNYLHLGPGILDLSIGQSFRFNARDPEDEDSEYNDSFYLVTFSGLGYSYPLWTDGQGDKLVVRPRFGIEGNWNFDGITDQRLRTSPTLNTGTGIDFGSVDWIGNFRDGWLLNADLNVDYSVAHGSYERSLAASASLFREFGWFGLSMRLKGLYLLDGEDEIAGEDLRGILNKRALTDAAYVLNLDFPVRLLRFRPSSWFGRKWMRVFDFEQQWSPFLDISHGHFDDGWFRLEDGWYAGGLEVVTFPTIMRSIYIRISYGVDLVEAWSAKAISGNSDRDGRAINELFIGLGHHY